MTRGQNITAKRTFPKRIAASELGVYETCGRAWWYQRQGVSRSNQRELEFGRRYHQRFGTRLLLHRIARGLLLLLLAAGVGMILYAVLFKGGQ